MKAREVAVTVSLVILVTSIAFPDDIRRPRLLLSGKWDFALDAVPVKDGEPCEGPPFAGPYQDSVEVPGNWNVQRKAWKNSLGPGWYRREVVIPERWRGKQVHLIIGGVMRRAKGWLNGLPIGEHDGFDTPFRWNVTNALKWGKPNELIIMVDARRLPKSNLEGCMIYQAQWGGIFRQVYLEAVSPLHITDMFVVPDIDGKKAVVHINTTRDRERSVDVWIGVDARGAAGRKKRGAIPEGKRNVTVEVPLPKARLWSPDDPFLYEATAMLRSEKKSVDCQSVRFGMRKIEAKGGRFYLNNHPIFLRGYGNDCVYPISGSPPVDKKRHLRDFRKAKELGFLYVRHHSWTPPLEYVKAADEAGMLLQLELPDAYRGPEGQEELLKKELERIILHYRNHPSVFAYCLGNEADGPTSYIEECHEIAKRMDPTRLFQSYDHFTTTPDPTDYRTTVFRQLDGPFHTATEGIEKIAKESDKPIIFHEMGNFNTFPDLNLLNRYTGYYNAYWLKDLKRKMEGAGQVKLAPLMHRNSCRYQALAHKLMIEATRASDSLDGYQLWLITDFPGEGIAHVGVFNNFWDYKGGTTVKKFQRFNADAVLLLGDPRWNHRSGEKVKLPILISHYGHKPIRDGSLAWSLKSGGRTLARGGIEGLTADCYRVSDLATIRFEVPDVQEPVEARLEIRFWGRGGPAIVNDWPQFFYPNRSKDRLPRIAADIEKPTFLSRYTATSRRSSDRTVFVTEALTKAAMESLVEGTSVLLLAGTRPTRFRPAWWNQPQPLGHVIQKHPAMAGVPHEGWAGLQFYRLLDGSHMIGKEGQPQGYEPLFYVVNRDGTTDGGLVSEFQVGKGRLIVCGLNVLSHLDDDPAALALLDRLILYLSGEKRQPAPTVSRQDLEAMGLTPLAELTGFSKVMQSAEQREYPSFLGSRMMHITRAVEGASPLVWRTKPVPKTLPPDGWTTFTWIGGCGWVSQPTCTFTLFCNEKPVLDLPVTVKSARWDGADGAVLEYRVRSANTEDSSGIFSLTVPNSWLNPREQATLKIVGLPATSNRWFGVYEVP